MNQRGWSIGMGVATLAFVGWALAREERLAELIGSDVDTARAMAARDLGSAIVLLTARDPRPALVARVLYDVSDAVIFGRSRPKVAASALGFAALGIAGLRAR